MITGDGCVKFDVRAGGAPHILRIFTNEDLERDARMRELSVYTKLLDCPHLTPQVHLQEEMLVFDSADRPVWVDVVIQRVPEGERLDLLSSFAGVRTGLKALAEWLAENDFAHGNICAKNVYVRNDGTVVLTDYTHGSRRRSERDGKAVELLISAIEAIERRPDMADAIRAGMVNGNAMRKLPELLAGLETLQPAEKRGAKYTFIGDMHDMLMRAFDGKSWTYIDKAGNEVFPVRFANATDFAEGRAVVETAEGYGLIDLDGKYVIEPQCDDIEWDHTNNVAIVTTEGLSGLFDRMGMPLTGVVYDQILPGSEGMFPVRRGGRYGFVAKDGKVKVEPQWDDASGYREGLARVRDGANILLIDLDGNVVEKISA